MKRYVTMFALLLTFGFGSAFAQDGTAEQPATDAPVTSEAPTAPVEPAAPAPAKKHTKKAHAAKAKKHHKHKKAEATQAQ